MTRSVVAQRRPLRTALVGAALAAALAAVREASCAFLPAAARGRSAAASPVEAAQALDADAGAAAGRRGLAAGGLAALAAAAPALAAAPSEQETGQIATFRVDLEGNDNGQGEIKVLLRPDWAPRGVRRFQELVRMGEFDDAAVFHVDEGTAHFGFPATPTLEPARIKDDLVRASNSRGTLTFVQGRMPHQRVNQLLFNRADNKHLDKNGFAPIGEIIEGMELVDRFYDGYGKEPKKDLIAWKGNSYLDEEFPKLSKIKKVDM